MFFAISNVVACEPTGFAEAINALAIHGGRGARAAFVQIINELGGVSVAPDFFSRGAIEASEGFEIATALAGAAQHKHASVGHGHAGKAHANFRAPSDFAEVSLGQRLARDAIVPGPAPVRPVLGLGEVNEKQRENQITHGASLSGGGKQEKLPFYPRYVWIM